MKQTNLQKYMEYNEEKFTKRVIFKEGESAVFVLNFAPKQKHCPRINTREPTSIF